MAFPEQPETHLCKSQPTHQSSWLAIGLNLGTPARRICLGTPTYLSGGLLGERKHDQAQPFYHQRSSFPHTKTVEIAPAKGTAKAPQRKRTNPSGSGGPSSQGNCRGHLRHPGKIRQSPEYHAGRIRPCLISLQKSSRGRACKLL